TAAPAVAATGAVERRFQIVAVGGGGDVGHIASGRRVVVRCLVADAVVRVGVSAAVGNEWVEQVGGGGPVAARVGVVVVGGGPVEDVVVADDQGEHGVGQ